MHEESPATRSSSSLGEVVGRVDEDEVEVADDALEIVLHRLGGDGDRGASPSVGAVRSTDSVFVRQIAAAAAFRSTSITDAAPRLAASRPSEPEPA